MLAHLSKKMSEDLILTLDDPDAGMIGGYCEEGFPIYYANEKIASMLGYSDVEDLIKGIGGMVSNTIHPDDMERVVVALNNGNFYEGMTYKVTYRMPKKDGSFIWTVDKGRVLKAADGRLAILSICTDMTEFIDNYGELERQNQISKFTLENMPGGYHQCAAEEGFPFLYVSERFLEIFGWTRNEIREKFDNKFINMLHPDDRKLTLQYVDHIQNNPASDNVGDVIYRMKAKKGYIWVTDASSVVRVGKGFFYQGTITDISDFVNEQEKRAQQLKKSMTQLEEMQDIIFSSNLGTWRIELPNEGHPRLKADKRMFELLGINDAESQKMSPEEVYDFWFTRISTESIQSVFNSVELMKQEKKDENTYLWNNPVLGERYVRCGGIGHKSADGYVLRGYHYDVDDIVRAQMMQHEQLVVAYSAAEQASRAKTVFLSSMSHDIRTPLNAIIGFTALARTHHEDAAMVQDYLSKIQTASAHLLNLINDILDMSRIESGSVHLDEKPLNLPDMVKNLETMVLGLVSAKQQTLHIDANDIKHNNVVADKLRVNQILLNIVSNAIKFTGIGGDIFISMSEKPCEQEEFASYEFIIRDTGIGISEDFIGNIFDSFSREQSSTVSGIQGTGLGLSIVKNIVHMMGGTIAVESEEGKGSTFTVNLTLRISDTQAEALHHGESEGQCDFTGKRALIVEDNELNSEIAQAILEDLGMEVDVVVDGIEAVNAINTEPEDKYDVVLMDIQMPKMDGYSATKEIRTLRNNKKANIPIVAMTANAFEEDRRKAFECGMNGHIAKPLRLQEIIDNLRNVLM